MAREYLLKWLPLSVLRRGPIAPAAADVLTLRLGVRTVNTDTQYVVDITAGTHDIAPVL